jgi:hypothetical protein
VGGLCVGSWTGELYWQGSSDIHNKRNDRHHAKHSRSGPRDCSGELRRIEDVLTSLLPFTSIRASYHGSSSEMVSHVQESKDDREGIPTLSPVPLFEETIITSLGWGRGTVFPRLSPVDDLDLSVPSPLASPKFSRRSNR